LGERVLLARRRRGWTQRELAVQAGLNPVTVARLERGRMPGLSVALAWRLAQALGCSLDTLAGAGAADSEALDAHP
jgi:transcriptional regulator with XRE-family HTH domain